MSHQDEYYSPLVNENRVELLLGLRNEVNWEVAHDRHDLLDVIEEHISWPTSDPLDVRDFLSTEQIECLLWDSVDRHFGLPNQNFIELVARSGYRDQFDGRPLAHRRGTPLHLLRYNRVPDWRENVRHLFTIYDRFDVNYYVNIQNITNNPKLFKIYNRFDVNYTDEVGFTHFHAACMYGCYYTAQKFLNHGHDPNCIERGTDCTPLHYSLTYENPEVTELLLRRGANPNLADAYGSTHLHIICSSSIFDEKSAKMLFQMSDRKFQPVQVDARDKFGETPLHKVYQHRNKHAIEFLLRHDADPNAANEDRSTPLHVCCKGDLVNYDLGRLYTANYDSGPPSKEGCEIAIEKRLKSKFSQ
ncbi:tankyrase-2-like [Trichogramma pretiosum]|uniref:tankyrase-2-like n=1 Tax=Trichogramma pretiosum TaxID=7493 RepID=UPI000C71B650|nr:tankyrase-2-like [Trichogramma pretiosum]